MSTPTVFAEIPVNIQQEEISPYFLYIVDASSTLGISNQVATVTSWVEGEYNSATKAKVVAELQEKRLILSKKIDSLPKIIIIVPSCPSLCQLGFFVFFVRSFHCQHGTAVLF